MDDSIQPAPSKRALRRLISARLTVRSFGHTRKLGARRIWRGLRKQWSARRRLRVNRFSSRLQLAIRDRQLERFGLDVTGHAAADERRKLRNARKRERHAS